MKMKIPIWTKYISPNYGNTASNSYQLIYKFTILQSSFKVLIVHHLYICNYLKNNQLF